MREKEDEASLATPKPTSRRNKNSRGGGGRTRRAVAASILWVSCALLFWTAALIFDLWETSVSNTIDWKSIAWTTWTGVKFTMLAALAVACAHVLHEITVRTRLKKDAIVVTAGFCALVTGPPLYHLTHSLTSGDWISGQSWSLALRIALLFLGLAGTWLLVAWHLLLVLGRGLRLGPRFCLQGPVLTLAAAMTTYGGFVFAARALVNYSHLATFIIAGVWLLGASVLYSGLGFVCGRVVWPRVALCALAVMVGGASSLTLVKFDVTGFAAGRVTSLSATMVYSWEGRESHFDVSRPERWHCQTRQGLSEAADPWPGTHSNISNVLLISSEALRRDLLEQEVAGRVVTPHLRTFRQESLDFSRAAALYPATIFSLGGVVNGLSPSEILFSPQLPLNLFTLTQEDFASQVVFLPDQKWFKLPVIAPLLIQSAELRMKKSSSSQTKHLIAHLKRAKKRKESTFAWIHYYDPHSPYRKAADFDFGEGKKNAYFSEVAHVDEQMGRLFRYLESAGWYENTLIIIFGDHGQALGERGYFGHHVYLNSWITDVPLIVRAPGLAPRSIDWPVGLSAIAPTVLHYLGRLDDRMSARSLLEPRRPYEPVVAEAFPFRGRELFKIANTPINGLDDLKKRMMKIEATLKSYSPKVAVIDKDWRLIVERTTKFITLYDTDADPENRVNLSGEERARVEKYEKFLRQWHEERSKRFYCEVKRASAKEE